MGYKSTIFVLLAAFVGYNLSCDFVSVVKTQKLLFGRPIDGFVPKPPPEFAAKALASNGVTTGWFTQKLDHFDPSVTATWSQLYQKNDQFYKPGGPMFVMISGEAPADISWMTYGQWYKNAQTFGALMFQLEHRFYGSSHPTNDATTANLKYLTSAQALADLDAFINAIMVQYNIKKTIVFGGSYAGNLAAWYTEKYSTAVGSIASSAPVTAIVDFSQYLETVGTAMDYFNPGCYDEVQQGFINITQLFQAQDYDDIDYLFEPCPPGIDLTNDLDISTFFNSLISPWAYATQYTAPDAEDSLLSKMCTIAMNSTYGTTTLDRLSFFYNNFDCCTYHDYPAQVALLKQTNWSDYWVKSGTRQWTWQTCNEFGYYQSTDSKSQPFGQTVPVSYLEQLSCTKIFGEVDSQITNNTIKTNNYYGGSKGGEKRTFLINGSLDPWHNLAIYQSPPDPSDIVAYINGTSHCYDMMNDLSTDSPQLTAVRNQITQQIALWLK